MTTILSSVAYGAERNVVFEVRKPGFENHPWGRIIPWDKFNAIAKLELIHALLAAYLEEMPSELARIGLKNTEQTISAGIMGFPQYAASDYNLLAGGWSIDNVPHPAYPRL